MSVATPGNALSTTSSRSRARLVTVVAAVLAPLVVWIVVDLILGVGLRSPASGGRESMDIGPANVIVAAALASLAGWALLALLERLSARARAVWSVVATLLLLASLGLPFSGTDITAANRVALVLMHLAVGALLILGLRRTSPGPDRIRADKES